MFSSLRASGYSPAKRSIEESQGVRAGRETKCICGNVFMPDSDFCRKCGRKRADVMQQKVAKTSGSEVDDRLKIVCAFLRRPETEAAVEDPNAESTQSSLFMLANGTRDCLGPKKSSRDKHQTKNEQLIGEIFKFMAKAYELKIDLAKKALDHSHVHLVHRKGERDTEEKRVDVCTAALKEAEFQYNMALDECQKRRDELAERERELADAEAILRAAQDVYDFWQRLHDEQYKSLVKGDLNPTQVETNLNMLVPKLHEGTGLGKKWGFEDCLMGAFSPASREQNLSDRCDYCKNVFNEMDKGWKMWLDHLKAEVEKAKRVVAECKAARDAAEQRRYQACDVLVPQKEAALREAEKQLAEAKDKYDHTHHRVLTNCDDGSERVVELRDKNHEVHKETYEYFKDTEYAAYLWLCDQESGVYNHHDYVQISEYNEGEVLEKVKLVQRGLSEGEVSRECIDMLTFMAPLSLGPTKTLRAARQGTVNGQIGEVLDQVVNTKRRRVAKAQTVLAAAKAKEADAETKKKAAENELKRKESELEIAHKKYEDACERCRIARQEVAVATAERDQAQAEVDHLLMILASWQDAYDHHFVPLRDGPGVPKADSHLGVLKPVFSQWGEKYEFEDCLLAGFYSAAHDTTEQRHSWCKKVVAEVDRLWKEPVRVKKAELTKAELVLVEKQKILDRALEVQERVCNREVPAAEKDVQRCTDAVLKAREILAEATVVWNEAVAYRETCQRELDDAEADLKRFLDYWAAYQWLLNN